MRIFCVLLLGLLVISACQNNTPTASTASASLAPEGDTSTQALPPQPTGIIFYAQVSRLKLREMPQLGAAVLATVPHGSRLEDLGVRSDNSIEARIQGKNLRAPFRLVQIQGGVRGWVFEGAIQREE